MSFTDTTKAELAKPLNRDHVAQRQQGGGKVSYIEGWHAIAEANRIFGFDAWTRETLDIRQLGEPRDVNGKMRVDYMARVRITVGDVIREGCGFGQGIDRDVGQAHESALKEAETDAMKRALMTFGNPFGLALYDKSQANVADAPAHPAPPADALINDEARDWIADKLAARQLQVGDLCAAMNAPSLKALTYGQMGAVKEWIRTNTKDAA